MHTVAVALISLQNPEKDFHGMKEKQWIDQSPGRKLDLNGVAEGHLVQGPFPYVSEELKETGRRECVHLEKEEVIVLFVNQSNICKRL